MRGGERIGRPPAPPARHFPGIVPKHDHLCPLDLRSTHPPLAPLGSPLLLNDAVLFPGPRGALTAATLDSASWLSVPVLSVETRGLVGTFPPWFPSAATSTAQEPEFSGPKGSQARIHIVMCGGETC